MTEFLHSDFCILGGGGAGLAAARVAAGLGAKVVIVEKHVLGGNYLEEAIPLQAFRAAAASAAAVNRAARWGIGGNELSVNLDLLGRHVDSIVKEHARKVSLARLRAMNIDVIRAPGTFTRENRLEAGSFAIEAKYFLIATGAIAPRTIAGLDLIRPLTPDALSTLEELPKHLVIAGGSFRGLLMAQAFLRLGVPVSLIDPDGILPAEDPEFLAPVMTQLIKEGLLLREKTGPLRVEPQRGGIRLIFGEGQAEEAIEATHLMPALPTRPLVDGLGLKAADVTYSETGITIDADGRTSNRQIYAAGDVVGGVDGLSAGRHQGERIARALFGSRPPAGAASMARVLPTDPEIAMVGLSEAEARARHKTIQVLRAPFADNERARSDYGPEGHVKIVTDAAGTLLGAGIVGPQAGELIGIFSLAIAHGLKAADLEALIATVPTLSEVWRSAALASLPQVGKASVLRSFWPPRRIR